MPSPTYTLIQEQTFGTAQSSVTFSSIPQTYKDLVIEFDGNHETTNTNMFIRINGDTGTNYSKTLIGGDGTAYSIRESNQANIRINYAGYLSNTNRQNSIIHIMSYANSNVYKTVLSRFNNGGVGLDQSVGLWRSTASITSVTLLTTPGNFSINSIFRLWGIVG